MAHNNGSNNNNNANSNKAAATMTAAPSLNMYQKIAIIRKSNDSLTYEDNEGNVKSVSAESLGDAIANATPLITPKTKLDIPVPRINDVILPDVINYQPPRAYVRLAKPTPQEWMDDLHYLADAEDEAWLQNNAKFGGSTPVFMQDDSSNKNSSGDNKDTNKESNKSSSTTNTTLLRKRLRLSLQTMELMMDILEKETAFDVIVTVNQAETFFAEQIPQLYDTFPSSSSVNNVTTKDVIQDVYNYWVNKRSKLKRPLLRQFWPVTSTDDTNPHLVFRPREKEKYKLRKKRQNDMDAYRKMKQLRDDFDNLRAIIDLVCRREELSRTYIQLQVELMKQRIYELTNTSGEPRESTSISKREIKSLWEIPVHFDVVPNSRKAKRIRPNDNGDPLEPASAVSRLDSILSNSLSDIGVSSDAKDNITMSAARQTIAGSHNGNPAPTFLHPLDTRQQFATSYDLTVPHVTTYVNSHAEPTFRFSHRPRVGRGGRLCIDRVPSPVDTLEPDMTFYTAGVSLQQHTDPKRFLLDLLPRPLDHASLSRKVEEMSVAAIRDDMEAKVKGTAYGGLPEENDGDEVVVRVEDWLDTDEQPWGEERFTLDTK